MGRNNPNGFDCSGLVQYVCNSLGINVNRVAEDQFKNGTAVNKDELQPGDLVSLNKTDTFTMSVFMPVTE